MTTTSPDAFEPASPFLRDSDLAVSFSDPALPDQPLVWVNGAFCRLVGRGREECEGRNCRFLQGEGTDPAAVARVREGIEGRRFRLSPIVNYRSGGERFTNGLLIGPVRDPGGELLLLFGMQWDIDATARRRRERAEDNAWGESEPDPRLAHFERLIDRVAEASRGRDTTASPGSVVERLVAISRPQQYPPHERMPNWTRANSLLPWLAEPYGPAVTGSLRVEGDAEILAVDVAHPLALAVHELARAAFRHVGPDDSTPRVEISCGVVPDRGEPAFELVWRAPLPGPVDGRSDDGRATRDGLAVVAEVAALLGGRFETDLDESGLEAVLRLPNRLHEAA